MGTISRTIGSLHDTIRTAILYFAALPVVIATNLALGVLNRAVGAGDSALNLLRNTVDCAASLFLKLVNPESPAS